MHGSTLLHSWFPRNGSHRYGSRRGFRPITAAVLVLIMAVLAACGPAGGPSGGSDAGAADPPGPSFPMVIEDDAGRTVTIPEEPERIIALAPSHTEVLFAIGAGDKIVGVDSFSDYPAEAADLPDVGGVLDPNLELMVELEPDLFLSISGAEEIANSLAERGIPALIIQPETFEEVLDSIMLTGSIAGVPEAAAQLVASMEARVAAVEEAVAGADEVRVFYEVWHDPLMTVGPGGFIDDLIALAGGKNVGGELPSAWSEISLETVVAADPEIIITTFVESRDQLLAGERPGWSGMAAVKAGRVMVIDEDLISRTGPRLVDGLEELARAIHPDRFD